MDKKFLILQYCDRSLSTSILWVCNSIYSIYWNLKHYNLLKKYYQEKYKLWSKI